MYLGFVKLNQYCDNLSNIDFPLVSVVIPVYNTGRYLEQCILSARNQTYPAIEIVVVDDGSNKETKEELHNLKDHIDIFLTQENAGQSTARNKGIRATSGDYILILDSDDYFMPEFVTKAISELQKKPSVKFVSSYIKRFHENTVGPVLKMEGGPVEAYLFRNASIGNGLFRKKDIAAIKGYDQEMREGYEDWELMIRLLKNGGEALVLPEVLFMYRSSLKLTTHKAKTKRPKLLHYVFCKHRELYENRFEATLDFFRKEQERLSQEVTKIQECKEFTIGAVVLSPIRFIKKMFAL